MKYNYITIEREYGSGGTKIAKGLAEKCQIPCYGREILEAVAKKRNISVEAIEQYEEKATNSFLYTIFVMNRIQSGDADMLPEEGHIYLEEQKEIQIMKRIVLVRHGESQWNKENRFTGWYDVPLSDKGIL